LERLRTNSSCREDSPVVTVASSAGADFVTDGTDDNVEIQAAIEVVASGGGTVLITAGTRYPTR
jgi:polygalacturonase